MTVGVGHGKKAARHIDAWLRSAEAVSSPKHEPATFDKLNLGYVGDNARRSQTELGLEERVVGFGKVLGGLSAEEAVYEAGWCLSCGLAGPPPGESPQHGRRSESDFRRFRVLRRPEGHDFQTMKPLQNAEVSATGVTGLEPATSGLTVLRSNQAELHPQRAPW